ncbi:uncharacterized protein YpiB (UPF0302 family) [Scopulibacillus darangshiensis]|uniref:UPF0302 protein EV207_102120 n=1 Tax=Scopulibacillus darangshiensis TaxID=442528 RepID=A0A4R2P9B5_9BACL|nr:ReoY family proteolytic degradation factor [Scopulibacillus darangshiensis]TCP31630.1 uncharacterized protein YpiB (UPF0302 family) [Scopulibacillus darangshiensis]
MEQIISVNEKRDFLKWFLNRFHLKSRECVWLLNYCISDDHLLSLFRFVDNIHGCTRSMVISEKSVSDKAFEYHKRHVTTDDPEKAFHDIRLNQEEPIFVQVNFSSPYRTPEYVGVLEDNPFCHKTVHDRFGEEADKIILKAEEKYLRETLNKEIDKALDEGDKETFEKLTNKLKMLNILD